MTVPDSAPPRRRRLLAAGLGVTLAVAGGEVVARIARPQYAERVATYEIVPVSRDPASWVYRPGSTVTFTWDGDPLGVLPPGATLSDTVNDEGYRGTLPPPGRRPVVLLGDSFTFGEGVLREETFAARLDAAFAGTGVTFVNAGVSGHGTVEEVARLDGLITRFDPVAVILVFVPNDAVPWDASAAQTADLLNMKGGGGSRLLELVTSLGEGDHAIEDWYLSFYTGARAADWARAKDALTWMAQRCRERGVRFGVVHFPLMHRLDAYPFAPIEACVAAAAASVDVPYLDLTPGFAGRDAPSFWVHPADRHPNAAANAVAAELMQPFVETVLR